MNSLDMAKEFHFSVRNAVESLVLFDFFFTTSLFFPYFVQCLLDTAPWRARNASDVRTKSCEHHPFARQSAQDQARGPLLLSRQ